MKTNNRMINVKSLPGPQDIARKVLPNGITLLARSNFNSASVVLSGYVGAGSLNRSAREVGVGSLHIPGADAGNPKQGISTNF